jgi:hypothetical protein
MDNKLRRFFDLIEIKLNYGAFCVIKTKIVLKLHIIFGQKFGNPIFLINNLDN